MTSRTIDIHCHHCRNYLFSLMPNDYKGLEFDYYCKKKACKQAQTAAALKGDKVKNG